MGEMILALDPATKCGYAIGNEAQRFYGVWIVRSPNALQERLELYFHEGDGPQAISLIVYEDAIYGTHRHHTTAFHGELRGIIKAVAERHGIKTLAVNPMTLKKFATGHGHAEKDQMIRACKTILGVETQSSDIADALFLLEYGRAYKPEWDTPKKKARRLKKERRKEPKLFK